MNGGGRYLRHPDGRLELIEEPTQPHPDGDAPRNADGIVIGADGTPVPPPEAEPAVEVEPSARTPDPAAEGER